MSTILSQAEVPLGYGTMKLCRIKSTYAKVHHQIFTKYTLITAYLKSSSFLL